MHSHTSKNDRHHAQRWSVLARCDVFDKRRLDFSMLPVKVEYVNGDGKDRARQQKEVVRPTAAVSSEAFTVHHIGASFGVASFTRSRSSKTG